MKENKPNAIIKAVIIDDDIPSGQLLAKELSKRNDIQLCGIAENLADGEKLIDEHYPDIIFLDMEFPKGNGLTWYEETKFPPNAKVVFHTCYQRYIHDALSLHVFDFLLKPFDASELEVVIRRYKSSLATTRQDNFAYTTLPLKPQPNQRESRLLSITSVINSKVIVNPSDVVYFRYISERKTWECVFANLKRIILKRQTTAETILGYGPDFVRTHKHFIVNVRYIGIINGNDCLLLPPLDSITEIKISKSYRRDLLDRFYDI